MGVLPFVHMTTAVLHFVSFSYDSILDLTAILDLATANLPELN